MMRYVDGFVIPVPKDRLAEYQRMAEVSAQVWKEHGALDYWEGVGDDLDAAETKPFLQLIEALPTETVVFAWAVFPSREARDAANEKIMADPRLLEMMAHAREVFDFKRMACGGFKQLVSG